MRGGRRRYKEGGLSGNRKGLGLITAEWAMFVFRVGTECCLLLNKFDFKMNSFVCLFLI
jgi:hypothetical protein